MIGKQETKVAPHNPKMRRQETSQMNGMPAPAAIRPSRSDDNAEINWIMLLFALGLFSAQFIPFAHAQPIIKKSSSPKNSKSSLANTTKQPLNKSISSLTKRV